MFSVKKMSTNTTTSVSDSASYSTALATCSKTNNKVTCIPKDGVKYEDAISTCASDSSGLFKCNAKPTVSQAVISTCNSTEKGVTCNPKDGTIYSDSVVNCKVTDSKLQCVGRDPLPSSVTSVVHSSLQLFNTIGYWLFAMTILLCVFSGWWVYAIKSSSMSSFVKSYTGPEARIGSEKFIIGVVITVLLVVASLTAVAAFYETLDEDIKSTRAGLFSMAIALAFGVFIAVWLNLDNAPKLAYPAGATAMSVIVLSIVLFIFVSS